jgi:hypothetical protein
MDIIRFVSNGISRAKLAERMGLTRDAGLVNLFNPGAAIIGGGVALAGDLLTTSIHQAVRGHSLRAAEQSVHITGRRSSLIDATVQAINITIQDLIEKKTPVYRDILTPDIKQAEVNK